MTIPSTHADILSTKALAHVATIGPDGAPQNNPVWFDWDGTHLKFSHLTSRQKYRNIMRVPLVAVSITDPENPMRYLEIRGSAEIVDDEGNAFINSMAQKYMNQPEFPWRGPNDHRVVIKVLPTSTTSQG